MCVCVYCNVTVGGLLQSSCKTMGRRSLYYGETFGE